MKKLSSLLLSLLLIYSFFIPAIAQSQVATPSFSYAPNESLPSNYIPIINSDHAFPIYAFTGLDVNTTFRVFATLGNEEGFYSATLTKLEEKSQGSTELQSMNYESVYFNVEIDTSRFITDSKDAFAKATLIAPQGDYIEKGYSILNSEKNLFGYTNIFNQTQYRTWASFNDQPPYLYPANSKNEIKDGALPIVQTNDLEAKMQNDSYQLTEEFVNGWQQEVILKINNEDFIGLMDYPSLSNAKKEIVTTTTKKSTTGTTNASGGKNLSLGSKGERVYALTDGLAKLGYLSSPTQNFDNTVKNAVIQFQKDNDLKVDGIAGEKTLNMLNYLLNIPAPTLKPTAPPSTNKPVPPTSPPPTKTYPYVISSNPTLKEAIAKEFVASSEVFDSASLAKSNAEKGTASGGNFTDGKEAVGIFKKPGSTAQSIASALKNQTPALKHIAYIDVAVYDFFLNAEDEANNIISLSIVIRGKDSNY